MVTQVIGLSRNGVSDWLIQRISAYILALYTVVLVGYLAFAGDIAYADWKALFDTTWMQVFTMLALLSLCAHAWIGMWTVGTDYMRELQMGQSADSIRLVYLVGCDLVLIVYLVWGVKILWG